MSESGDVCCSANPSLQNARAKTIRRDAVTLVRLYRAGELTEIWTPDEAHEASLPAIGGKRVRPVGRR